MMENGWLEIEYLSVNGEASTLRVPRAPFEVWALRPLLRQKKITLEQLERKWLPISPMGFKMCGMDDDPCHTDWLLGAGLNVDTYEEVYLEKDNLKPLRCAIYDEVQRIQQGFDSIEAIILSGSPRIIEGTVIHPRPGQTISPGSVVVLPSLRPSYFSVAMAASAVITEAGGLMAHLAVVGREQCIPIVRVGNALQKFAPGAKIRISFDTGRVEILKEQRPGFAADGAGEQKCLLSTAP